jgi:hypothetical protein
VYPWSIAKKGRSLVMRRLLVPLLRGFTSMLFAKTALGKYAAGKTALTLKTCSVYETQKTVCMQIFEC